MRTAENVPGTQYYSQARTSDRAELEMKINELTEQRRIVREAAYFDSGEQNDLLQVNDTIVIFINLHLDIQSVCSWQNMLTCLHHWCEQCHVSRPVYPLTYILPISRYPVDKSQIHLQYMLDLDAICIHYISLHSLIALYFCNLVPHH